MPEREMTGVSKKDYRVTVRLDPETYQSLREAVQQGAISNLSEALRSMIRQKLWEERFSQEIGKDLSIRDVSEEELREVVDQVVGDFETVKSKEFLKLDGVLEGMFSAMGGIVRKAMVELERRHTLNKTRRKS
jgi:Arc/MetJ-type ribon-helix-helix transcriptional regulator